MKNPKQKDLIKRLLIIIILFSFFDLVKILHYKCKSSLKLKIEGRPLNLKNKKAHRFINDGLNIRD